MGKAYDGKEPCQGCGTPGSEKRRRGKNQLCPDCKNIMEAGKRVLHLESVEYIRIRHHINTYDSKWLNVFSHAILELLHVPNVTNDCFNPKGWHVLKSTWGDNVKDYDVPARFFEPLQKLFLELDDTLKDLRAREEEIPRKAREEVNKEYDRIFMEGIKKGRNLLLQLNKNEVSLKDFERNYGYYERIRESD